MLSALTDADIMALFESPAALASMSPLERELMIRLVELIESSQAEIHRLDEEVERLSEYVPAEVEEERLKKAQTDLMQYVELQDKKPKVKVQVESNYFSG